MTIQTSSRSAFHPEPVISVEMTLLEYGLFPNEFALFARITILSGGVSGWCEESARQLAQAFGISKRAVDYSLRLLETAGMIEVVRQSGERALRRPCPVTSWADIDDLPIIRQRVTLSSARSIKKIQPVRQSPGATILPFHNRKVHNNAFTS